jgi:anti-sigma-K factor RskA
MSDAGHSDEPKGDDVLVPEFVLGLLDQAGHEAFARRLGSEPALRRAVAEWRARLQDLDAGYAETPAPATAWGRIEARLFGAHKRGGGWWNSLALWRGLTTAALAVAVVAVGFNLVRPAPLDPEQFAVQLVAALQAQEGSGVEFVAFYDTASGTVKMLGLQGQPLTDKDYELWYIRGEEPAVSMGVIPVDQKTEIPLDAAAREKIAEGTVLAVTLEQKGGSPTGVAQGPIVALGTALAI